MAFRRLRIPVAIPTGRMPSGGFMHISRPGALLQDVRNGLVTLHLSQALALRKLASSVALVVGVGDRVILYANKWLLHKPLLLVSVADSAYLTEGRTISNPGERRLMQRYAKRVFTRDELSARLLRQFGIEAEFAGNPIMDALQSRGPQPLAGSGLVIALLPGSRKEAYANFCLILEAVLHLGSSLDLAGFVTAWPDDLLPERLSDYIQGSQWELSTYQPHAATAEGLDGDQPPGLIGQLRHRRGIQVDLVVGRFADVVQEAKVAIGLAGTANEQAAGLGKPVVVCPGVGPQMTMRMVRRQQLLLGEAVRAVEPSGRAIADAVIHILANPDLYRRMSEAGRTRMGPTGGARRIAAAALEELRRIRTSHGG